MKSLCEKLKTLSLGDKINVLIAAAGLLCELIFQGVFKHELPRFLFSLCFFGFLLSGTAISISAYRQMRRQRDRYERQRDKLLDGYDGDDAAGGYRKVRRKEIEAERRFRVKRRKLRNRKGAQILIVVLCEIFLCLRNPINSLALWNAVLVGEGQSEEANLESESELEPAAAETGGAEPAFEGQEEAAAAAEDPGPLKPLTFRFVLEDPDRKPDLEPDIESAVFFLDKKAGQTLEEYVDAVMEEIAACWRAGTDIQTLEDGGGHTFYTYTEAENVFKRKVEACQSEKYYYIWAEKAPTSKELDRYMEGREKLNLTEQGGRQGSPELWWKLANDNQYYALEYEAQTQNGDAVLYYYVMSIFCAMEALKYDMPEEQKRQIYHYMVMRYHDIGGMTLEIPLAYKELAEDIYGCLEKSDEMLETEKEDAGLETDDAV